MKYNKNNNSMINKITFRTMSLHNVSSMKECRNVI